MANKDRNKRSARKARAQKRAEREAAQAASAASNPKQTGGPAKRAAVVAKASEKQDKPAKASNKKPGLGTRIKNYLGAVRTEMRRVVWPSREELRNYSVAVIVSLVVFGVVLWLVDTGIVAALVGYTSLGE
ncbi:preprotein translocase subunit SecE [Olsenella sp. Marseille-P4559]|uniref:preprotein translocase subunit SecE n=1 Tax=Olsenella sp. Marseille-P4559 TaxID=2364795 RepID=UPI00103241CA|nr:preprotein translocase subunit SecE [Olsenella sp. Marseille-P4559]